MTAFAAHTLIILSQCYFLHASTILCFLHPPAAELALSNMVVVGGMTCGWFESVEKDDRINTIWVMPMIISIFSVNGGNGVVRDRIRVGFLKELW